MKSLRRQQQRQARFEAGVLQRLYPLPSAPSPPPSDPLSLSPVPSFPSPSSLSPSGSQPDGLESRDSGRIDGGSSEESEGDDEEAVRKSSLTRAQRKRLKIKRLNETKSKASATPDRFIGPLKPGEPDPSMTANKSSTSLTANTSLPEDQPEQCKEVIEVAETDREAPASSNGCALLSKSKRRKVAKRTKHAQEDRSRSFSLVHVRGDAINLAVGASFKDIHELKYIVERHAVAEHFELERIKCEVSRFTVGCKAKGCQWRLHASRCADGLTRIKTFNAQHSCAGPTHGGNIVASSSWIAREALEKFRDQPDYRPKDLIKDLTRDKGLTVSYKVAWAAKEKAMTEIHGDHERSYKRLEGYCQLLLKSNPGSVASVQQTTEGRFLRMFLAFGPCLLGFQHCRPFIGLDATFMKNKYLGVLFTATGIDANGQLYPLAFGIGNVEDDENWFWFVATLRQSLGQISRKLTLVSDWKKGLIEGVAAIFGEQAEHAYCMHHFTENLRKQFKDLELVELLWTAARAITMEGYVEAMGKIDKLNPSAAQWIIGECNPKHWASVYFKGERYGYLTLNIAESLNAWLLECREFSIISMLEKIRENVGTMFFERRMKAKEALDEIVAANGDASIALVQSADEVVKENIQRGSTYQVLQYDEVQFEVKTGCGSCVVHLGQFTCSCKQWQSSGIPCAHAVAAILYKRQQVEAYARKEFSLSAYYDSYGETIVPFVANEASLGSLLPPLTRRPPGRPKERRIRTEDIGKEKRPLHCDRCKGVGHNKRTCRVAI